MVQSRTIGISGKNTNPLACRLILELVDWLKLRNIDFKIDEQVTQALACPQLSREVFVGRDEMLKICDPVVVFGGDGTLISVARNVGDISPIIIGVNVGTLGYLTECAVDEYIPVLESVLQGEAKSIKKQLLEGDVVRCGKSIMHFQGVNDVVVGKGALGRIYGINLFINDENAAYFRGDGIIVATPTGSTAYSLAAGGAVVHPRLSALLVTPICSHVLTSRPLVLPGDVRLRLNIADEQYIALENKKKMYLTVDGQIGQEIEIGDEINIKLSARHILLTKSPSKNYFDVLSTKLKWGIL